MTSHARREQGPPKAGCGAIQRYLAARIVDVVAMTASAISCVPG